MPPSRPRLALVPASNSRSTARRLTRASAPLLALALAALAAGLTLVPSIAGAQGRPAPGTPLHVPTSRFEFVASDIPQPTAKPLAVHNGGSTRLTGVRLTRLAYVDSARGAKWLLTHTRQTAVAPDELATVGTICVDPSGLPAGTYRATAAVDAREVAEPVAITVTLTVTDAGARARHAAPHCGTVGAK